MLPTLLQQIFVFRFDMGKEKCINSRRPCVTILAIMTLFTFMSSMNFKAFLTLLINFVLQTQNKYYCTQYQNCVLVDINLCLTSSANSRKLTHDLFSKKIAKTTYVAGYLWLHTGQHYRCNTEKTNKHNKGLVHKRYYNSYYYL